MRLFNDLCKFILHTSTKYKIDESHSISHSMNVLHYAHNIYEKETNTHPIVKDHKNIIYLSATLHDMCDNKYMNEQEGLVRITDFLQCKITEEETAAISSIIDTMSYSKVKVNGFPDLGIYQTAYHIVREADLLSAYDFDRCIIYDMNVNNKPFDEAFYRAEELFHNRVFKHNEDNLFTTEYAKNHYPILHSQAITRIKSWKSVLHLSNAHIL